MRRGRAASWRRRDLRRSATGSAARGAGRHRDAVAGYKKLVRLARPNKKDKGLSAAYLAAAKSALALGDSPLATKIYEQVAKAGTSSARKQAKKAQRKLDQKRASQKAAEQKKQ